MLVIMSYSFTCIFDNIAFELQRAGGISVYWAESLLRMKALGSRAVYFGRENSNIFCAELKLTLVQEEIYPDFLPRRYLPFQSANKKLLKKKHIFHSSYFRYSNHPNSINVTTVHDFTYEHFIRGPRLWVHRWQKKLAVKKSQGIICVSENTKKDLLYFYPWVDSGSIKVIHNGVGDAFFPVDNPHPALLESLGFSLDSPYLLFVGDRSAYKNFDAFVSLAEYFPDLDMVLVGGKPFTDEETLKLKPLSKRLHHFRGVSSSVLNNLYNAAHCLIYPSSYEGFGIPVLEAMKAGCPVVSTNLSSIPEVAGDAALLVDTPTPENLASAVLQLSDFGFRSKLRKKGFDQAAQFSWDKCFQETQIFYQELWNKEQ
jgi:mannosyltransferase